MEAMVPAIGSLLLSPGFPVLDSLARRTRSLQAVLLPCQQGALAGQTGRRSFPVWCAALCFLLLLLHV